jgi:hypothetical protein
MYVIRIVALAGGIINKRLQNQYVGGYVKRYDPEAFDGRGDVEATMHAHEALKFKSTADAMAFWHQHSKTRPLREDGQPNRPLTAFTIEVVAAPHGGTWGG